MKKLTATLIAVIYSSILTLAPVLAVTSGSVGVQGSVIVLGVCDLTVEQTALIFGSLDQGATSSTLMRDVSVSNANIATTVKIFGTKWTGVNASNTMPVGKTTYGLDANPVTTNLLLSPGATLYTTAVGSEVHSTSFKVTIPNPQAADTYSQTVTFDFSCNQPV